MNSNGESTSDKESQLESNVSFKGGPKVCDSTSKERQGDQAQHTAHTISAVLNATGNNIRPSFQHTFSGNPHFHAGNLRLGERRGQSIQQHINPQVNLVTSLVDPSRLQSLLTNPKTLTRAQQSASQQAVPTISHHQRQQHHHQLAALLSSTGLSISHSSQFIPRPQSQISRLHQQHLVMLLNSGSRNIHSTKVSVSSPSSTANVSDDDFLMTHQMQQGLTPRTNSKRKRGPNSSYDSKSMARPAASEIAKSPSSKSVPCRCRGMPDNHNPRTAFIIIPEHVQHGQALRCSHPICRRRGVRFRYCANCRKPFAKRNFSSRHSHTKDSFPTKYNRPDVLVGNGNDSNSNKSNEAVIDTISEKTCKEDTVTIHEETLNEPVTTPHNNDKDGDISGSVDFVQIAPRQKQSTDQEETGGGGWENCSR